MKIVVKGGGGEWGGAEVMVVGKGVIFPFCHFI